MKDSSSRRLFLQKSALATTGLAFLSSGVVNAFSAEIPFEGYNPYAEEKNDLRTSSFGEHIRIKGVVLDQTGSLPLSNVMIEVWHLSPESNKYRHHAKFKTDSAGCYNFITDFPAKDESKANKIYFKLSDNSSERFNELYVDRQGANITCKFWKENQQLGEKLLPTTEKLLGALTINFNMSL